MKKKKKACFLSGRADDIVKGARFAEHLLHAATESLISASLHDDILPHLLLWFAWLCCSNKTMHLLQS